MLRVTYGIHFTGVHFSAIVENLLLERLRNAACGFALIYLQALPELFISPTRLPQQSLEIATWKDLARHVFSSPFELQKQILMLPLRIPKVFSSEAGVTRYLNALSKRYRMTAAKWIRYFGT
jgi:hypothetical protein